jgi:hypothetical protein
MDYNAMREEMQVDIDTKIRTKGLSILARILAVSLIRKYPQLHKSSDVSHDKLNQFEKDDNASDINNRVGDEQ